MNSPSLFAQEACPELVDRITHGISVRGFHIFSYDELEALWPEAKLSGILRVQRIHQLAETQGWSVTVRALPSGALFRPRSGPAF